jgi:hypothetical protein
VPGEEMFVHCKCGTLAIMLPMNAYRGDKRASSAICLLHDVTDRRLLKLLQREATNAFAVLFLRPLMVWLWSRQLGKLNWQIRHLAVFWVGRILKNPR